MRGDSVRKMSAEAGSRAGSRKREAFLKKIYMDDGEQKCTLKI